MNAPRHTGPPEAATRTGERTVRAGLLLAGVLLLAANLRAGITAVGPVLGEISDAFGFSSTAASLLISLPLIGFATVSPLAPALARRFGLERTLAASLALLAVAIVIRSAPLPGGIWVGTALLGATVATLNVLLPALIKREYPGREGRFTGIYTAIQSGVAALAAGFAVPLAGATPAGWRLAIGVWAGLALIGLAAFLPLLRDRARGGLVAPAGGRPGRTDLDAEEFEFETLTLELPSATGPGRVWRSALAWQITVFMALQSTVYYVVITWWPTIEAHHGISTVAAGWHQFVFQILAIGSALTGAALIHRHPSQSVLTVGFAGLVPPAILGQLLLPELSLLWIALLGIAGGGTITITLSLFGLRTRDHHQAASLSGMAQSVGYLLAACGPLVIGALHGWTGAWTVPLLTLAGLGVVEIVLGWLAGRDRYLA